MSHRIAAKISGVAGYVPPKVLTNADLEKLVETNDEWIRTRTGIRERHIAEAGTASSHLATEAAKLLLEKTKTDPAEIDLIIVASVTPDMFFPATACLVQDRLGAKRAWGFDLSAACSAMALEPSSSSRPRTGKAFWIFRMMSTVQAANICTCRVAARFTPPPTKRSTRTCMWYIRTARKCSSMPCVAWPNWPGASWSATALPATISPW